MYSYGVKRLSGGGGGGGGGREERCLSVELESDLSVYACALTRVCKSLHYCVH